MAAHHRFLAPWASAPGRLSHAGDDEDGAEQREAVVSRDGEDTSDGPRMTEVDGSGANNEDEISGSDEDEAVETFESEDDDSGDGPYSDLQDLVKQHEQEQQLRGRTSPTPSLLLNSQQYQAIPPNPGVSDDIHTSDADKHTPNKLTKDAQPIAAPGLFFSSHQEALAYEEPRLPLKPVGDDDPETVQRESKALVTILLGTFYGEDWQAEMECGPKLSREKNQEVQKRYTDSEGKAWAEMQKMLNGNSSRLDGTVTQHRVERVMWDIVDRVVRIHQHGYIPTKTVDPDQGLTSMARFEEIHKTIRDSRRVRLNIVKHTVDIPSLTIAPVKFRSTTLQYIRNNATRCETTIKKKLPALPGDDRTMTTETRSIPPNDHVGRRRSMQTKFKLDDVGRSRLRPSSSHSHGKPAHSTFSKMKTSGSYSMTQAPPPEGSLLGPAAPLADAQLGNDHSGTFPSKSGLAAPEKRTSVRASREGNLRRTSTSIEASQENSAVPSAFVNERNTQALMDSHTAATTGTPAMQASSQPARQTIHLHSHGAHEESA